MSPEVKQGKKLKNLDDINPQQYQVKSFEENKKSYFDQNRKLHLSESNNQSNEAKENVREKFAFIYEENS
jgi:hypothetical protein